MKTIEEVYKALKEDVKIKELIEQDIIERSGSGKAIYYVLKQVDARVDVRVDAKTEG